MRGTLLVVVVLCGSQVARAEDNLAKARAYFQAGVDAYDEGKYEVALREFQHSHALSHNPALYFNMAACEEHLTHYQAAALLLRQYLIEKPDADDKAKVETRIQSLDEREESLKRPEPAPTVQQPPPVPAPVTTAPPPPPPAPAHKRVVSWAMLGVTGALGIGAIGAGAWSVVHHDDLKSTCGMTPQGCSQDQIDGLRSATIATDVLIGLTAASAVVTVVLFIVEPKLGKKADRAAAHLTANGVVF